MTTATFKKLMGVHGEDFCDDTCPKLQAEIIRKIMNCKSIDDFTKMTMLRQYMGNLTANRCIVEAIKEFNSK